MLGPLTGLGLLELWHLIFPKLLAVWHTGLLHKLKSYGISSQIIDRFPDRFPVVLDGTSSQEYPVKAPFLVLHFSYYTLITFLTMFCDDTTLYSKCDQASDLWQQIELASELESDLQDTVDWAKKWLVDFNAGKTQLVSFDRSNNNGFIHVKMDRSVLEKKSLLRCWG